jgi:hypothetical protein
MVGIITSWDDPYIEPPDQPTELEAVRDQYPDVDPNDYPSWDDLTGALWDIDGEALTNKYRAEGSLIHPDPVDDASKEIDRCATVLWASRTQKGE